jgi:flagellar hook-basal body complex protein FliE
MAIPAAAAAAYQAVSQLGSASASTASSATGAAGGNFSDFLSGAIKDSVSSMQAGEQAATQQVSGKANIVDVVNSVNSAEITLDTVVAVRDKVVAAYQSIMNMPI